VLIVDSQVHAWERGEATGHHRKAPITADVLLGEMATAGVDRVVLVPPLWDPDGNDYSLAAARRHPEKFAVVGLLPLDRPDSRERLLGWNNQPGMLGARFLFNTPDRLAPFLRREIEWVWPTAEKAGLPLMILIPGALPLVAGIAERFPGLRIIVDHLGVPRGASGPAAFEHLPQLIALSRFPNIAVKAAGVGDYALDPYPYPSLNAPLRRVFDAFGPDRMIWGSDLSRLRHPYRDCVTHFADMLPWLTQSDREKIMGRNLCRWIGWDVVRAPVADPASHSATATGNAP
jgi:predicted TIM-barrel fold metal-dependent hydrolase